MLDRLAVPIIQAPMLGAVDERIVVAVSSAGGLGSHAGSGSNPEQLAAAIGRIRAQTDKPFAVNLFVQSPVEPEPAELERAVARLAPWRARYGLPEQSIPNRFAEPFAPQFKALVEAAPPAASFTFGMLTAEQTAALKARGTWVIGTATTVAEARAWAEVGADAICAQGLEAGGHRGTFLNDMHESAIGTLSLVRTIRTALDLPLIAAGGITDGAGIAAALSLGADAVQIGTAYLLSDEATTNPVWRRAIAEAGDDPTRLTRAISGRWARGIDTEFMRAHREREAEIPAYPIQNALTQELRAAGVRAGSPDVLSLWAGQSVKLARGGPAADITRDLWREARAEIAKLATRFG